MFHYYKLFWLNMFKLNGRARRKEFWYPVLMNIIVSIVGSLINNVLALPNWFAISVATIFNIASTIAMFTVTVRRNHDIGMTMKFATVLYGLTIVFSILEFGPVYKGVSSIPIPEFVSMIIGVIVGIVFLVLCIISIALCATSGQKEPNQYGKNPKYA
ncbi:DUF805 domain-containing protein [Staphylococcus sp. ACRSN]|uniref:DUF805 domain-containing protein n=1 Tax=Staphylococcus sp. ACRSN TaxID=2918214 RepID=UPI001EF27C57|nr:DUF805 domain-containing protein [Staphylococcus sp. ACRSN]MCG7337797.1 DUF805 domain-containing protein [Staphylococcus sp. ACRSN]